MAETKKVSNSSELEEKDEDDTFEMLSDSSFLSPSEARAEHVLSTKLALDATDMGALHGIDFEEYRNSREFLPLDKLVFEETRASSLSPSDLKLRLRPSHCVDKPDDGGTCSPRGSELSIRRSSNLSQLVSSCMKKPCSNEVCSKDSTTPTPPNVNEPFQLGPKRQSNLAVMRLIAETL